jgi:integrase
MAIAWGEANENPMQKVRFDRENNQRIRFLSVDEEERLLPACNNWLRPLVITALNTGFRRLEFLSLTWEDIDFERRAVEVQASYAKNGERRSISMNDLLHRTLEEVRIKSPGPVFPNRKVTQYRNFRTPFNNALWKAEISNFTFHDLRHTFASRPVMSGIDLPTVKELMGHKDITMTLRYTHLSSDHKQNAVKALDNFGTNLRRFSRQYENEVENGSSK